MPDEHKHDGEFEGRTYLLIRDHILDDGNEPLPAALPAWLSPDISVRKPDGTLGGEAEIGGVNHVEVTVRNLGGVAAIGVYVDAFFTSSATGFTPATAALIGGTYVDVPGYGMTTVALPWVPDASYSGHGCILARASLIIPPDSYADPTTFDARGDRHVAQRNIEVIGFAEDGESVQFMFNLVNPLPRPIRAKVEVRELRDDGERRAVIAALACQTAAFAPEPLKVFGITLGHRRVIPGEDGMLRDVNPLDSRVPVARSIRTAHADRKIDCALAPGEICEAVLHATKNSGGIKGLLHPLEIRQTDEHGTIMGGVSVILCN